MTVTAYPTESPPAKILAHLQRHQEATIRDLEELLGISTTAVREHLTHLEARGLIGTRLVRSGPGRPKLVYSLLPRAQELFPKEYGTLVTMLLRELASRAEPEQLEVLLDAVGTRLAIEYGVQIGQGTIDERLKRLRIALAERGIPADVDLQMADVQIYACPYHDVAREHAAICTMERRMFEEVLGQEIRLEGAIREGQRSCHFIIERPTPA
jgi:DeoR family transcriptional regulator, suf operon transcriptional repressor